MWHVHWASLVGTVGTVLVLLSEGLVVDSCYWKLYCWDGYRGSHNEDTALMSYYNLCPISPHGVEKTSRKLLHFPDPETYAHIHYNI